MHLVGYEELRNVSDVGSKAFQHLLNPSLSECIRFGFADKFSAGQLHKNEDTPMQISCREVRKELAHYMKDDISPELRGRIERHFVKCDGCFAIYDGLRKVIRLVNSTEIIELPEGFSVRLYRRIVTSSDSEFRKSQ